MDNLIFLYNQNFNGKVRKKHEWKCVIESTYMFGDKSTFGSIKNGVKQKNLLGTYIQFNKVAGYMKIQRFKYAWEQFPHLKCENGSECRIGMECPDIIKPP